jgi:hypothetical protein
MKDAVLFHHGLDTGSMTPPLLQSQHQCFIDIDGTAACFGAVSTNDIAACIDRGRS